MNDLKLALQQIGWTEDLIRAVEAGASIPAFDTLAASDDLPQFEDVTDVTLVPVNQQYVTTICVG